MFLDPCVPQMLQPAADAVLPESFKSHQSRLQSPATPRKGSLSSGGLDSQQLTSPPGLGVSDSPAYRTRNNNNVLNSRTNNNNNSVGLASGPGRPPVDPSSSPVNRRDLSGTPPAGHHSSRRDPRLEKPLKRSFSENRKDSVREILHPSTTTAHTAWFVPLYIYSIKIDMLVASITFKNTNPNLFTNG